MRTWRRGRLAHLARAPHWRCGGDRFESYIAHQSKIPLFTGVFYFGEHCYRGSEPYFAKQKGSLERASRRSLLRERWADKGRRPLSYIAHPCKTMYLRIQIRVFYREPCVVFGTVVDGTCVFFLISGVVGSIGTNFTHILMTNQANHKSHYIPLSAPQSTGKGVAQYCLCQWEKEKI